MSGRRFQLRAALLVALAFVPAGAWAGSDCADAGTQAQMNECAMASYQRVDDALNAVYKQAAARAKSAGGQVPTLLLAAQRAWISYRDASCKAEAELYAGGSIMPLVHANCLQRLTGQRIGDLRAAYLTN